MRRSILLVLFFLCSSGFAYDAEWWKHTIIYQIIPYVYKDSDGDGVGDLKGITSKLDHFVDLGIKTLHLTPIFETSFKDMGYDTTDYYKIDSRIGTMDDFDELVREMNKRNLKLVLDLVINHCGYKHEWFDKSIHKIEPYTDFYIWRDSRGIDKKTNEQIPPNDWHSIFDQRWGKAWTWNEDRQQFYFHHFLPEQPDLNLRNELVKEELKKIVKFWLDKNVAGFRLDAASFYFEDEQLRDYVPLYDLPEVFPFIHEFRVLLDEYSKSQGDFERIFFAEVFNDVSTMPKYYGKKDYPIVHYIYNIFLSHYYFYWPADTTAMQFKYVINEWMDVLPEGEMTLWLTDYHDYTRYGSAVSSEFAEIFTILSMMLPGSVVVYYGQEIGMKDGFIMKDQMRDYSFRGLRDPNRLIMQWDDGPSAGFSTNLTTFSPSNTDYFYRNVQNQKTEKISAYYMFRDLSDLRKTNVCKFGKFNDDIIADGVYTVTRSYENEMLAVLINFNAEFSQFNASKVLQTPLSEVSVAAASVNSGYSKGFIVEPETLETFFMRPASSVVLWTTL